MLNDDGCVALSCLEIPDFSLCLCRLELICVWLPSLMPMMKFSEAYYVGLEAGLGSL